MSAEARRLGKYQLLECIALGGMGEVWKVLDTQLKRYVAIKLLRPGIQQDPDFITRFEQEARLIASLHHPNIIKIHNFHVSYPPESDPPLCYMVMDYVKGETLAGYIRDTSRCGRFPPAVDIVYIFTVIGQALDYAHQCGMIHRDIKPANILLDQRISTARPMGEPILTDFGIARQRGATSGTIVGSVVGTPMYIAPEQAQGRYDDPRSDLYSLGIILYEVVTGVTPFRADTPLAIVMKHLHEEPTPPAQINPRVSPALSEVILKSITKDPDARFSTAAALAAALAEALNVPAPERLEGSDEQLPWISSSSAPPLIYIPPLLPSSAVQTPFEEISPGQSLHFPGAQKDHSVGNVSNADRPIGSVVPRNILEDMKVPTAHVMPHQLIETPQRTQLSADVPLQVGVVPHELQPGRDETKRSRFTGNKKWVIGLVALLVLVLLGSGLSAMVLFLPSGHGGEVAVGRVSFVKNGPSQAYNAVQIDIAHLSELPQGMAYYAWIELRGEETRPHWALTVNKQSIYTPPLTFPGIDNLHVPHSLFLITREHTDYPPIVPDTDPSARLYYARVTAVSSATLDLKRCPAGNTAVACF